MLDFGAASEKPDEDPKNHWSALVVSKVVERQPEKEQVIFYVLPYQIS